MLFRQQALDEQSRVRMGDVLINQPRIFPVMTAATLVIVFLLGLAITFGTYSRKETVRGYLAPASGIAAINASRGGVITEVLIEEGDLVRAGTPLIRLSFDSSDVLEAGSVAVQLVLIDERIHEAETQLEAQARLFEGEDEHWRHTIHTGLLELTSLREREALAVQQMEISQTQLDRWEEMVSGGIAPRTLLDARRLEWISSAASLNDLRRLILQRADAQLDARHSLDLLPSRATMELSRTRSQLASLRQSRSDLERSAGYAILAPIDGRVTSIQASIGMTARPNHPLAAIVPAGVDLRAFLLVPTRSAGFLRSGQSVKLRIDAFPYQRFGSIEGDVTDLSSSPLTPEEVLAPIPVVEAVYRMSVDLPDQAIDTYGTRQPLIAGMTLSADVIVDNRPLWRWIVDPVLASTRSAATSPPNAEAQ